MKNFFSNIINKFWGTNSNGYLPDENPPFLRLVLYSLQCIILCFPATVAVALITGFDIAVTVFASGFATLCFVIVTKGKVPLYFGSSFSYISAVAVLMSLEEFSGLNQFDKIAVATFGIACSGIVNIIAGLIIKKLGIKFINKVLPPSISGSVAMVIGLTLAGNAIGDALGSGNYGTIIALVTLISMILFSVYLKGIFQQLSLLLGVLCGLITSYIVLLVSGVNLFRELPNLTNSIIAIPHFVLPKPNLIAVISLAFIAIATIPESFSHLVQIDKYVDELANEKNVKSYNLKDEVGNVLIGDGVADIAASIIGGPGGTSYGEGLSGMAITKIYSTSVIIGASIIAMIISLFTPLMNSVYSLPVALIGGMEIFVFGCIAVQGIAIMQNGVDFFKPKDMAIIACISIIGIGGQYAYNGVIPIFGMNIPCIACAALFGIILNLILSMNDKEQL